MHPIFKKLNYKDQKEIVILKAPESFVGPCKEMETFTTIHSTLKEETPFVLLFVTQKAEIIEWAPQLNKALQGDGLLWFAYPKKSSKKYKSDVSRDDSWAILGEFDFEPVRMVAIDEDWSALRFRRVDYIKKLTRSTLGALSEKGKEKVKD